MSRILSDLWNGSSPLSDNLVSNNAEAKQLLSFIERHQKSLYASICDQQRETFDKYTDCYEDYLILLTEHAFCRGFSFAIKLLGEAIWRDN